jgi:hypothetical protein
MRRQGCRLAQRASGGPRGSRTVAGSTRETPMQSRPPYAKTGGAGHKSGTAPPTRRGSWRRGSRHHAAMPGCVGHTARVSTPPVAHQIRACRSAPAGRQPASALPSRTRSRPGVARSELRDCGSDGPCSPAAANVAGNSRLGEGGKGRGRRGRRNLPLRRALLSARSWPPPPQARGRRPGSRRGEGLVGGG